MKYDENACFCFVKEIGPKLLNSIIVSFKQGDNIVSEMAKKSLLVFDDF